jgi:chemotaxis protein CheD
MTAVTAPMGAARPSLASRLTPRTLAALPATYLHPGQQCVSAESGSLTTILGSCVAVCLHDGTLRIGGLNHFLLPTEPAAGEAPGRYAPSAVDALVAEMLGRGAVLKNIVAQIVGGASVLAAFGAQAQHLGLKNVAAAREAIARHSIPVIGTDVGGTRGRKLVFSPREGATLVQLLGK